MKKHKWLLVFSVLFIFGCGIIEIAPSKKEKFEEYKKNAENQTLIPVVFEDLDKKIRPNDFLIIWAPWCPHCLVMLDELYLKANKEQLESMVFVSSSYDLKGISKVLNRRPTLKEKIKFLVIDGDEYGAFEDERIRRFSLAVNGEEGRGSPIFYEKTEGGEYITQSKSNFYHIIFSK